jgi:hypothetical protein
MQSVCMCIPTKYMKIKVNLHNKHLTFMIADRLQLHVTSVVSRLRMATMLYRGAALAEVFVRNHGSKVVKSGSMTH